MNFITNNRWIKIRYTFGGNPYFIHKGKRYNLNDFIRVHNNMWISGNFPDYIHEMSQDYFNPVFIQISNSNDAVKVWKEARLEAKNV